MPSLNPLLIGSTFLTAEIFEEDNPRFDSLNPLLIGSTFLTTYYSSTLARLCLYVRLNPLLIGSTFLTPIKELDSWLKILFG